MRNNKNQLVWGSLVLAVIAFLLALCMNANAQSFEIQRAEFVDGELKITSTKRFSPLARAYDEQKKLYKKLKAGEILIGPSVTQSVNVVVKDVDGLEISEPLTVSIVGGFTGSGFSIPQLAAINQAIESWNYNGVRFIYRAEGGQIKINRGSLTVAALSEISTLNDKVASAQVLVDLSIQDLDALRSAIAHELGHVLGLPDSQDKRSVMYWKTKGRNKGNGHVRPTAIDFAALWN